MRQFKVYGHLYQSENSKAAFINKILRASISRRGSWPSVNIQVCFQGMLLP